jgi:hypothetical protein
VSEVPFGTAEKIRKRAIWAVALFAASVVPAIIGVGIINATVGQANIATPFAFSLWAIGALFALAAAIPTLRHWDGLPVQMRWLGALPMLCVSLFLSIAIVVAALRGP